MSNLPWKLGADNRISNNDGLTVADCRYKADQGRLIVQAVNAFEPMLQALKACQLQLLQSNNDTEWAQEANELAKAAIALAEGK